MKQEDKYTNKSCWSFSTSHLPLYKSREECKHCSSKKCSRRLTLFSIPNISIMQTKLDKQQNEIDKWQEKIKRARILVKKYQDPTITTKQKSRKDS